VHLLVIAFVMLVVSYIIQAFLIKRPQTKPAALEDWDFPQWEEGTPQTVFFGDCWQDGPCVMWWGNYRTKKIKSKSGKK
jgi:hypothetical protein